MWYYKARFYSAKLGRFLQTDPVGYKDQVNLYAYVRNDPVDGRDPSGEADLNFHSEPNDRRLWDEVDMPGTYTIAGHLGAAGIRDDRGGGEPGGHPRYSPRALLAVAMGNSENRYHLGQTTLLLACSAGIISMQGSSRVYAQEYADLSGGSVIASPGLIATTDRNNQSNVETLRGRGFYLYRPHGGRAEYLGRRLVVDHATGKAEFRKDPEIGTRIPSIGHACLDPKKCGG
jgi:uncharacterized protein RhaS with RHS repeats